MTDENGDEEETVSEDPSEWGLGTWIVISMISTIVIVANLGTFLEREWKAPEVTVFGLAIIQVSAAAHGVLYHDVVMSIIVGAASIFIAGPFVVLSKATVETTGAFAAGIVALVEILGLHVWHFTAGMIPALGGGLVVAAYTHGSEMNETGRRVTPFTAVFAAALVVAAVLGVIIFLALVWATLQLIGVIL